MKTEAHKLYSRLLWTVLPNVTKIDPYNYDYAVSATSQLVTRLARHTVVSSLGQLVTSQLVSHVFFTESTGHNAIIHDGQRHVILGDFRVW